MKYSECAIFPEGWKFPTCSRVKPKQMRFFGDTVIFVFFADGSFILHDKKNAGRKACKTWVLEGFAHAGGVDSRLAVGATKRFLQEK